VRASAMMRRCVNEAMAVARNRLAFGEVILNKPLLRRQLMKLLVPTEQALSMAMFTGLQLERADAGDAKAESLLRILTPLLKFRTCRDNIAVATGAMEIRGGNGYIEDWVNSRLVRDAHLGVLWEGTSNINALDVTTRAVAKVGAHKTLGDALGEIVEASSEIPGQLKGALQATTERAVSVADEIAASGNDTLARRAADALYHVTSAVLLAQEGAELGAMGEDARRLVLANMVLNHRLRPQDPLAMPADEDEATQALLDDAPISLERARALATA